MSAKADNRTSKALEFHSRNTQISRQVKVTSMPALYEITFLPEGNIHSLCGTRGNYYQFADGSKLKVHGNPVWCRQCQSFVEAEWLQSVPELEQAVANYSDVNSAESQRILQPSYIRETAGYLAERLAESKTRLQWRRGRIALPKCLECGTTDISDLGDGQEIPSPCSPGTLTIDWVGMCSTAFRNYFYTPEGDRIPIDTQPSYWHMTR